MTYKPNHALRKRMTYGELRVLQLLDGVADGGWETGDGLPIPASAARRCIRILEIELAIHGERAGR